MLQQASLHNEAVQDSWTAPCFLIACGMWHLRAGREGDPGAAPPEQAPREGEEHVLLLEDPRRQGLLRVIVPDRDGLLEDDRSAVEGRVDEVDRAAGDPRAVCECIPLTVRSRERGEEGGVDFHDPPRERADELLRDEAHEPREHDEIDAALLQDLHELRLERDAVLPVRAGVHDDGRNARLLRALKDRGPGYVAHEDREVDIKVASVPRVDEALEVRAAARRENADADLRHRPPSVLEET